MLATIGADTLRSNAWYGIVISNVFEAFKAAAGRGLFASVNVNVGF